MHQKSETQTRTNLLTVVSVTVACMLLFMLNNGIRSNFGLISAALHSHTGLPTERISFAVAIAQLLYGVTQPFFGILALRRSNAFVLGLGGVFMAAGLLLLPFAHSVPMLYLSMGGLIGLAAGALAFGVVMGAATPAVGARYAAAVSGIINGAGGLGGAILAPVLQGLGDAGLFMQSMLGLAGVAGCVVLVCVWLGKKEREAAPPAAEEGERLSGGALLREALTSSPFLHLALAFFTCGFFMAIIETYLYPQMLSYGYSGSSVALMFTVYGIMGMLGPMLTGFLSGVVNPKWVLGTTYGLRPVFVLLFLFLPKNIYTAYLFIIGLGLTGNSTVPPTTLLIGKYFGNRKMPTLSGLAMVFHQVGSFLSTWLGSVLIAATGSYIPIWLCGGTVALAAAVLSYTVRTERA